MSSVNSRFLCVVATALYVALVDGDLAHGGEETGRVVGQGCRPCFHAAQERRSRSKELVGVSRGGALPEVPWFTLPDVNGLAYGPATLPPTPTAPYSDPTPLNNWNADNPSNSGFAVHANKTRFWASAPDYFIVIPPDTPTTTLLSDSFGVISNGHGKTWQDWIDLVNGCFDRFKGIRTANVDANFVDVREDDYRASENKHQMPANLYNFDHFIWENTAQGPTGNGINEIILTDILDPAPFTPTIFEVSGGLTSMLVDPATGEITECDVIIYVGLLFSTVAGNDTKPEEWTAVPHELAHFFGADHTNLNDGTVLSPQGARGFDLSTPFSLADFPMDPILPGAGPGGVDISAVPDIVGVISWLGSGVDVAQLPVHPNDAVSLSKIYPVCAPSRPGEPRKWPLINVSSRVIGRQREVNGVGFFGRNVWSIDEMSASEPGAFPWHGALSGMARLSQTDLPIIDTTGPVNHWVNPFGLPFFFVNTSVTGASNVGPPPPQNSIAATGDFSIDGLPHGSYDDANPYALELAFEGWDWIGNPAYAEWFGAGPFYVGNPLSIQPEPFTPLLRSDVINLLPLPACDTDRTVVSGLRTVPGSVIVLDPETHGESAISNAQVSGSMSGPTGKPFVLMNEPYARPLVDIQPRNGRWNLAPLVIRSRVTSFLCSGAVQDVPAFGVDPTTAFLYVDGNRIPLASISTSFPQATVTQVLDPTGVTNAIVELIVEIPMRHFLANKPAPAIPAPCPGVPLGVHVSFVVDLLNLEGQSLAHTSGRNDVVL